MATPTRSLPRTGARGHGLAALLVGALLASAACSADSPASATPDDDGGTLVEGAVCDLPRELLASGGVAPNGIPALTTPHVVPPDGPSLAYLDDDTRVLGVVLDGAARAYPHNILWWHEIVNDTLAGREIAVTFCPLTGSGLVFDRATMEPGTPASEIDVGVSGLLFANNLVMYDRRSRRLFGPQMSVTGRCESFRGIRPDLLPVLETSWAEWRRLHPRTTVVSQETGYPRKYRAYPYGSYDAPHNGELFVPMEIDARRPPKERVLGIRDGEDGGLLFPFGLLEDAPAGVGPWTVVDVAGPDGPVTVFHTSEAGGTAAAFGRRIAGETLEFHATEAGIRDRGTGTLWSLAGRAVDGPLAGARLEPVAGAYVAFWFAWRHFHPDARIAVP